MPRPMPAATHGDRRPAWLVRLLATNFGEDLYRRILAGAAKVSS